MTLTRRPLVGAKIVAIGAVCTLAPGSALSAADNLERLTDRWYAIEVVVFQRPGVTEATSSEHLASSKRRSFPPGIRMISAGTASEAYPLDPASLATLEFPVLSFNCKRADYSAHWHPPVTPAWYQPAFAPQPVQCGPDARRSEDSSAPAGVDCPPASFDVPLAPGMSPPLCARLPGNPPPSIAPALSPHPLLEWLNAVERFQDLLRNDSYQANTRNATMRPEADRIRNAPDMQVLWHGRWTQPVPPRGEPEPLLIQAGGRKGGVHELEGIFDITLGRYLHFHARIWLQIIEPDGATGAVPDPRPAPREDSRTVAETLALPAAETATYMMLEESRVMRSGTLHYLDHPRLGILVRADPLEPPDWLVDASAAIESAELVN